MSDTSIIAVGVDETESSRRALAWAAREALRRGATLQVITAWIWDFTEGAPNAPLDPQTLLGVAEETQEAAVAEVLGPMDPAPVVARAIVQSTPIEALVEASKHADLIVVGTHGRGPVRSFLLGSVSQSVIKHAACPVVVMPPATLTGEGSEDLATTTR
jgi:nucleotide-binding universal stress UspA family protein